MNPLHSLAEGIIPKTYAVQSFENLVSRETCIKMLLEQKKCPQNGWDEMTIEFFLHQLSLMDSNNFPSKCGIGEREARFCSSLVARRHFRMGHGIGRSGDIAEIQPKAAGSSLINKLTNSMVLDVLKSVGVPSTAACFVIPVATGMSMVICLLALRQKRPNAKYVIWPRIDQKSCFKCISTAGFEPIIIENCQEGDELRTDIGAIREAIGKLGAESILCVLTTTSCFAPRVPDRLEEVAMLCKDTDVPHVVNNAYGVQASKCMHLIHQASRVGRVDIYVQSTDKNFMVPVGGSIIAGFDKKLIEDIGKTYPGRASGAPTLDLFIALLSLGMDGYKDHLKSRKEMYQHLKNEMIKLARKHGERILETPHNPISIGLTLDTFAQDDPRLLTEIGSMLFHRGVSGTRVVTTREMKEVSGVEFCGWGSHSNTYPHSYLTAAAAIGITVEEIDGFIKKLDKTLLKVRRKQAPNVSCPQTREQLSDES